MAEAEEKAPLTRREGAQSGTRLRAVRYVPLKDIESAAERCDKIVKAVDEIGQAAVGPLPADVRLALETALPQLSVLRKQARSDGDRLHAVVVKRKWPLAEVEGSEHGQQG